MSGVQFGSGAVAPLMLPTIEPCIVQWNDVAAELLRVKPRELEPGAMSPRSAEPSSMTRRCTTLSLFRNTTVSPELALTGFGTNAVLPTDETIDTVTVPDEAVGVGDVGDAGLAPPPPP